MSAAASVLACSTVKIAAVVGFPSGAHDSAIKVEEAARAIAHGARELDMVINLGAAMAGDWTAVADVRAVRDTADRASPTLVPLKAIIESALMSEGQIVEACAAAERGGAQFIKTSTGAIQPAARVSRQWD